jgi:exodeoxyribonuclease V beta subunit
MRFFDYRELWLRRGVGVMLRKLLADEHVSERLLACADGERHLTNLLHLGELLHQATEAHTSPAALLRWLQAQRSEEGGDDAVQLRLESDQNLVQIVTIHKSKGLEYPIVFCPFLWDGRVSFGGSSGSEGRTYHDQNGDAVVDFRGDDIEKSELDAIKRAIKTEESAEFVRLLYVALTRAAHRCYLVAGCYTTATRGNPSPTESTHSLLNWLVAGQGLTPEAWFDSKTASASIESAWLALANVNADATAASGNNGLRLAALPTQQGVPVPASGTDPERLVALISPRTLASAWRVSSYSGLSQGATHEQGASDHDAYAIAAASSGGRRTPPEGVSADDVLRFPRGSSAGDCVHAAFECMDFSDKRTWPAALDTALSAHPQALPGLPKKQADQRLTAMLGHLLSDVTATELIPGLRLADIGKGRRLVELEFNIPAPRLLASELNRTLQRMGYPMPRLAFGELEGYLKGFIDLVFEHDGRFYILDWKSNHLGYEAADYSGPSIAGAMALHGYHLQYLLYTVALDRYLQRRVPDYDYDTHFGGVLYLFVRGVRPEWKGPDGKAAGVYWHRPPADDIASLQQLLHGAPDIKRHTNSGEDQ